MSATEIRMRWQKLTNEELDIAVGVGALSTKDAEAKAKELSSIRADTGFFLAGLAKLRPPPELAACHARATEGGALVKKSLDTINELWMQRLPRAADPRAQADALARDVCEGFAKLRSGREACGVALPAGREEAPLLTFGCAK